MNDLKIKILISIAIVLTAGYTSAQQCNELSLYAELDMTTTPNTLGSLEERRGWTLLFDGKTFQNWHGYNLDSIPANWKIDDGIIKIFSKGKEESIGIVTDKEYKNFVLSLECKLSKGANSGLIFQVAEGPEYKYPYETGPEFQIIDHENWPDKLKDWQIMGANYGMYAPKSSPYKNPGEWNHLLLIVRENEVSQILNGEIVVQYEKYSDDWKNRRNRGIWDKFPDQVNAIRPGQENIQIPVFIEIFNF